MRVTFMDQQSVFCSSKMIIKFLVLMLCVLEMANGWEHNDTGRFSVVYLREGEKCKIRTGESGICKKVMSCGVYVEALKQKTIEYSFLVRCSFAADSQEIICCPLEDTPSSSSEPTTQGPLEETSTRPSEKPPVDSLSFRNIGATGSERPSQVACKNYIGANPAGLSFHIIGGDPVSPGEYPHVGGLILPLGGGNDLENKCGVSLISERYVLTAAHCVTDPVAVPKFVRFGVVVWNSKDDSYPPVDVTIEDTLIHPLYHPKFVYHDIALIRLSRDVEFTPFVRPACLYPDLGDIDSDTPLLVVGWGYTNVETKTRSDILLMANVTTVDLKQCNTTHINYGTNRWYRPGLDKGQYCAFDPELKRDACRADSGGPLQLVRNKESTIVGIVSFGISCATTVPSVYTRVAYYLDWIEGIVWPS